MIRALKKKFVKIAMFAVTLLLVVLLSVLNVTNLILIRSETGQTLSILLENEQNNPAARDTAAQENSSEDPAADANKTISGDGESTEPEDDGQSDAAEDGSEFNAADGGGKSANQNDGESAVQDNTPAENDEMPNPADIGQGIPEDAGEASQNMVPPEEPDSGNSIFRFLFSYSDISQRDIIQSSFFVVKLDFDGEAAYTDTSHISYLTEAAAIELAQSAAAKGGSGWITDFRYLSGETDGETTMIFLDISMEISSALRLLLLSLILGAVCWLLMLLLVVRLSGRAIRPFAENMEKQRQFVTNAGHEIKTPLSIILANTDAMELYNGKNKWSGNIRTQVQRLNGLMKNLLLLAKMDEVSGVAAAEDFSLSQLVDSHAAAFAEPMAMNHLDFRTQVPLDIRFHGNKEHMAQLVSILLDNALKYADDQGPVQLSLTKKDKQILLSVSNTCTSLPDVPPERLFDRFYRADKARTQKNGGYGIGLSVAQSIVQAAKGTLIAEYQDGNRITFTAKL